MDVVRVVVIGGTRFIGRRITEQLVNRGDEVLVVHRGEAEPENWVRCRYGEGDVQRREEFILRRVRAGRRRIPVGEGTWRWTRVYVGDVARAVLAVLNTPEAHGEVFNLGESTTPTVRDCVGQILAAADHDAVLVPVPAEVLPPDLIMTGCIPQDLLAANDKARRVLGWELGNQTEAVRRSVRWHLAHPPAHPDTDFTGDDRALR